MAILKTEAIVLKSFNFRETSRIATFFTKDYGKMSGVLKGIRKDPRKFSSSLDKFSVNDIVYYQYRNTDLHLVSHCDQKEFFYKIRQDLKKSLAASYMLELINTVMPVEERNERAYGLMRDFLVSLEGSTETSLLVHIFQIKILLYSGFRPRLDACVKCEGKVEGKAAFSLREGGLICRTCENLMGDLQPISSGTVNSILYVEKSAWPDCLKLRLTESAKKELKYTLNNFLVFHLGRKLKSAKYV